MERFVYPAQATPDEDDGGFVVEFVDFPEAVTQGDDIVEADAAAADCLEEVIANRIVMGLPIPKPSRIKKGQFHVVLSAQIAAKAALYLSLQKLRSPKWNSHDGLNAMKRKCVVYWILIINLNYQELSRPSPQWGRN